MSDDRRGTFVKILTRFKTNLQMYIGQFGTEDCSRLQQFTISNALKELAPAVDKIYKNDNALMVITQNDEICVAESNNSHRLGFKQELMAKMMILIIVKH